MNYVAFAGWWFADPANSTQLAALYCSYGLLTTAPTPAAGIYRKISDLLGRRFLTFLGGVLYDH
jgi:hypothetical protein